MGSSVTLPANAKIHGASEFEVDEFKPIAISLHEQLGSCARLSTSIGVGAVRKAWATTLLRASNATRTPSFREIYADGSIAVVRVSLDAGSSRLTPPTTPSTTLSRSLLEHTVITYATLVTEEKTWSQPQLPQLPQHVEHQTSQVRQKTLNDERFSNIYGRAKSVWRWLTIFVNGR
jgi:hypothetical protein